MTRWSLVLLLGACDVVFQVDRLALEPHVTGTYKVVEVLGTTAVEQPVPSDAVDLRMVRPDGTTMFIDLLSDGTFSFPVPAGERYGLIVHNSQAVSPTEYVSRSRHVDLAIFAYGRRNRTPPTQTTFVEYHVQSASPLAGNARIASTGIRSYTTAENVVDGSINWLNAAAVDGVGGIGLLDASFGDQLYWLHFMTHPSSLYQRITESVAMPATLQDGQLFSMGTIGARVPARAVDQSLCVHLVTGRASALTRLRTNTGLAGEDTTSWTLLSTPSAAVRTAGGGIKLVLDSTGPTDDDLDVVFGSPFVGESVIAERLVSLERTVQVPRSSSAARVDARLTYVDAVTPAPPSQCATSRVDLSTRHPAVLSSLTIGDVAVTEDHQVVPITRRTPVPVTVMMGDGEYDDLQIALYEVFAELSGRTSLRLIRTWVTVEHEIEIDPVLLVKNRHYIMQITARRQFANAAQGDYATPSFPVLFGMHYSPLFQVGG